jgi:uncharacterized membrane protein
MPELTVVSVLHIILRWIHFVAGITWIGLLYFFNFVNAPFMRVLDPSARPLVIPTLLPRALAWFRHAAWVTVVAGLVLIYLLYWQRGDIVTSNGAKTIFTGMLLGLIMVFNVWFIIWPNQRRIIEAVKAGKTPDPAWGRTALYASRTNVTLSFPMLLMMAGATHWPMDWPAIIILGLIAAALAFLLVMTVQSWAAARF